MHPDGTRIEQADFAAYDIAVVAAVNSGRLVQASAGSLFRTTSQLRALASRLGLEIVEEGTAYLDSTCSLVLRKPL